jgi:hypothetical protein
MKHAARGNGGQLAMQDSPYLYNQVFATGHFAEHEINIHVQVFVIQFFNHFATDQQAQLFQIDYEARFRIRDTLNRHDEVKVMSMPVFIGTGSEHFHILLLGPVRIVQLVGCVKVFFARDVNHTANIANNRKGKKRRAEGTSALLIK